MSCQKDKESVAGKRMGRESFEIINNYRKVKLSTVL